MVYVVRLHYFEGSVALIEECTLCMCQHSSDCWFTFNIYTVQIVKDCRNALNSVTWLHSVLEKFLGNLKSRVKLNWSVRQQNKILSRWVGHELKNAESKVLLSLFEGVRRICTCKRALHDVPGQVNHVVLMNQHKRTLQVRKQYFGRAQASGSFTQLDNLCVIKVEKLVFQLGNLWVNSALNAANFNDIICHQLQLSVNKLIVRFLLFNLR